MGTTADSLLKPLRLYERPAAVPALDFTESAEATVERKTDIYREKLITISRSLAAGQNLDVVSKEHVESAARDLSQPRTQRKKHIGVAGGVMAGASLSALLDLFRDVDAFNVPFGIGLLGLLVLGGADRAVRLRNRFARSGGEATRSSRSRGI